MGQSGTAECQKSCIEKYLSEYAISQPESPAVIVKDEIVTYRRFWEYIRGFANFLQIQCSVLKGDRIVVKNSQDLAYAIVYFSVHLCGAIFVPLEKALKDEKCLGIIKETDSTVYISAKPIECEGLCNIDAKDVIGIAEKYFDENITFIFPCPEDSADIMYTTGTTGKAKGVEITHRALIATAENYITGFEMKKNNVIAVPGPMNHVNALRKLYMSIMYGTTIVILNGLLSIKAFYDALDNYGVTSLCMPPSSLRMIWKLSKDKLTEYASQMDFVEVSTAPVTEMDKETLRRQLPNSRLYNNYGLSECGAMVMYDFNKYPDKEAGCVGKPMINSHVIIVDDERKEIQSSKNHVGLIANCGPINMKGYWKAPELTAQTKANGYVYTNDIGYFDQSGFLYLLGRKDDTINVGGLKVEPTDVEEAALSMGTIAECICVPIEDPITGKSLKLFVVTKEGFKFDEDVIHNYLVQRLEPHQVPRFIESIDAVPKNYVGKPNRNAFENGILKKE